VRSFFLAASTAYLVLLHAALLAFLLRPEYLASARWHLGLAGAEFTPYYRDLNAHLRRVERNLEDGRVLFLGDSHVQAWQVAQVHEAAVNLGIGGETTLRLLLRLGDYRSLPRARAVVLLVGFNDLYFRTPEEAATILRKLLAGLPPAMPVVQFAVPPVDERVAGHGRNAQVAALNAAFRAACAGPCRFVEVGDALRDEAGNLQRRFHEGDGIHLNRAGYEVLTRLARQALVHAGLA